MNAKKILLGIVLVASFASAANTLKIKDGFLIVPKNGFGVERYINLREVETISTRAYPLGKNNKIIELHFANKDDNFQIIGSKKILNKILNFFHNKK